MEHTAKERTEKSVKQLQKMTERLQSAGPGYTTDVICLHSLDDWLVQIHIKATRARYAYSVEKVRDELIDTANYCALALSLIDDAEPIAVAPPVSSGPSTSKVIAKSYDD